MGAPYRMYRNNELYEELEAIKEPRQPCASTVLWRYMDLDKYVSMLTEGGIFFSNPANFDDSFEGSLSSASVDSLEKWQPDDGRNLASGIQQFTRDTNVVSCWHEMPEESHAMWRIYTGKEGTGVAIKTDYGSLIRALFGCGKPDDPYISGYVEYVDYDKEYKISPLHAMALFHKRKYYSYEREVRIACHVNKDTSGPGKTYEADLDELIHRVVVSPLSGNWLFFAVKEITGKFRKSLMAKVNESEMLTRPPVDDTETTHA